MTAQKRMVATLAGFVTLFLLNFLFYGVLLTEFMASNAGTATGVMKADADMLWWPLVLGTVFQAYLLVYVFGNWANISTFGGGLKAGAMIGLLFALGFDLVMYGTANIMNLTATLVDPLVMAVSYGVTGGVIGMVLGRK